MTVGSHVSMSTGISLTSFPRCRREDNIKMDHKKRRDNVVWINLAQGMDEWQGLVKTVMKIWVS
jgi:hypothetical protein